MVESDDSVGGLIPEKLWRSLIGWTLAYPHNNIYHSFFYRLVFAVLRQGQEVAHRNLLQRSKFLQFVMDTYVPLTTSRSQLPDKANTQGWAKEVIRGLILSCANAIRLQASSQPPSSFLRIFLASSQRWTDFTPELIVSGLTCPYALYHTILFLSLHLLIVFSCGCVLTGCDYFPSQIWNGSEDN